MKKYLNKATGVEVIVPCALEGPDWEEVTEAKAKPDAAPEPAKKTAPKRKAKASD